MTANKLDYVISELRLKYEIHPYDKVELAIQNKESAKWSYYHPEKITENEYGDTFIYFDENNNNFFNIECLRRLAFYAWNEEEIYVSVNNNVYDIAYADYNEKSETLVLYV